MAQSLNAVIKNMSQLIAKKTCSIMLLLFVTMCWDCYFC